MNGNTYAVTVSAINSVGNSVASETAHVTPATVPDPPTSLHATATERGAELEWSEAARDGGDPITGYRVRIWREATIVAQFEQSTTSASVPGLTSGVAYRVTVTSVNSLGESVTSEPAFVTPISPPVVDPPVVDPPPTFGPPSPPVDVTVIGTTRKTVTVGWRPGDSSGAPVIDFIVHVSRNKNRGFTVWRDSRSASPTVELPKPRRGKLYVRVITVTVLGESVPSPVTLVTQAKN
jgi:hypothetical protein